jgi:hypothetical protein
MLLERLLKTPERRNLNLAAVIAYIPFLFLTLFFIFNEHYLLNSFGHGVLDFELAWTSGTVNEIFTAWGPAEMHYQAFATYVDYLYIACYAAFGALILLIVARRLSGRLRQLGLCMILAPVLAGLFDVVENIYLLSMLNRGAGEVKWYSPFTASLCASFKIAFLGAGIFFLFIAILLLIGRRLKAPNPLIYVVLLGSGALMTWLFTLWNLYAALVLGAVYLVLLAIVIWLEESERGIGVGP